MVGQPHGDVWNQAQDEDSQHHQPDKRHGAPDDTFQFDVRRDAVDHEQVESDRRMDEAHFHEYGHDDAEPDQVDPHRFEGGQDDGCHHQDDGHRRQEEAKHDEEYVHTDEEGPFGQAQSDQPHRCLLGHAQYHGAGSTDAGYFRGSCPAAV